MRRVLLLLAAGLGSIALAAPASAAPHGGCFTAPSVGPFEAAQVCLL